MATVRFSKDLIERIVEQAKAKFEPAITKAYESKPDNSWGDYIYDTLFGEVKPFTMQAPAGWLKMVNQFEITKIGDFYCGLTFTFPTPRPWPYEFIETELAKAYSSFVNHLVLKNHLVWGEFYAEATAYRQRINSATGQRNEFVDAVKKICCTHRTLAQALKVWPPLWELVPDDVRAKHCDAKEYKPKEREEKKVVLDVDFDRLTTLSVAAKFGL